MKSMIFRRGESLFEIIAEPNENGWRVTLPGGDFHDISIRRAAGGALEITEQIDAGNGPITRTFRAATARIGRNIAVSWRGDAFQFQAVESGELAARPAAAAPHSGVLSAPMPGIVIDLPVKTGDSVIAFQPVAVIESMKVMATLESPFDGAVSAVHVQVRDQVMLGDTLVEITPTHQLTNRDAGANSVE